MAGLACPIRRLIYYLWPRSYGATAARALRPLCKRYDIASDPNDPPALARALALYRVFEAMKKERASRYRRMTHERFFDQVGSGFAFSRAR